MWKTSGFPENMMVSNSGSSPHYHYWLVVFRHPSEKYDFVNWDDEIPNINGKIKNGNQTTNQPSCLTMVDSMDWFSRENLEPPPIFSHEDMWETPVSIFSLKPIYETVGKLHISIYLY